MRSESEKLSRRQVLRAGCLSLPTLTGAKEALAQQPAAAIENEVLRVALSQHDASLSVVDKRSGLAWRQKASPGFRVAPETVKVQGAAFSAKIVGPDATYAVAISFKKESSHEFDLLLDVQGRRYTQLAGYPFPFAAPGKDWYFAQNTTGEGMLTRMDQSDKIVQPFSWAGGQPWWGITDLKRSMRARLDTFRLPGGRDEAIYAAPLRINYAFFNEGGYVKLAKEYRKFFLDSNPGMQPLQERTKSRSAVGHLKDAVYVYLWSDTPAEDLAVAKEMKAAGIDRVIAVSYGRHETTRAVCDGIKELGWVVGRYNMPTGNLFQVSQKRHWQIPLLTGKLAPDEFLAKSNRDAWARVCGKAVLKEWQEKAKGIIGEYGIQLFYFDTLVVQMAPCLHPDHPSTIEENQEARREIMRQTHDMGMLVGSGEGGSPTWAVPDLDFFEGLMSLRTYSDNALKIPSGDFKTDMGESYKEAAAVALDETRRIPLYQLGFHDYVAGTWVWRDTNFQSTPYAWKKDLFNILYGTMPMWHITPSLWARHKKEMVASYRNIYSVRKRIGFAEMVNHGWLTQDRSVQFTEWDCGDRVIVNFRDRPFERKSGGSVAQRSYVIERV